MFNSPEVLIVKILG